MSSVAIDDWAFRVAAASFVLGCIAVAVPQFFIVVSNSVTFGLRQSCTGNVCAGLVDFGLLQRTLNCDGSCTDAFEQFRLRWRAIEGFGWLAASLYLLVVVTALCGLRYKIRSAPLGAAHVVTSIFALLASGVSITTMWASVDCGKKCYEVGASAVAAAAAGLLSLVAIPVGLCAVRVKTKYKRRMWLRVTVFIATAALALQLYGLLTHKFLYTRPSAAATSDVLSVGIFLKCKQSDFSCSAMDVRTDVLAVAQLAGCAAAKDMSAGDITIMLYVGAGLVGLAALLCPLLAYFSYRSVVVDAVVVDSLEAEKEMAESRRLAAKPGSRKNDNSDDDDDDGAGVAHENTASFAASATNPLAATKMVPRPPGQRGSSSSDDDDAEARQNLVGATNNVASKFTDAYPATRCALIVIILLLVSAGNSILFYHLDSGLFCGRSFCAALAAVSPSTACELGISSVCSLIFNGAMGALLLLEVLHRCIAAWEAADGGDAVLAEWRRFTAAEQQREPDAACSTAMWHRWLSFALLLGTEMAAIAGTADPRWYVAGGGSTLGPFRYCVGAKCYDYSTEGCGGGQVGNESVRHLMVGIAAAIGCCFGAASLCLVFHRASAAALLYARLGCVMVMEVCLVLAVLMWWGGVMSCDGSGGAICAAAPGGCSFGLAFWVMVAAMGLGGGAAIIAVIEIIAQCDCSSSSSSKNNNSDKDATKDAPGAIPAALADDAAAAAAAPVGGDYSASATFAASATAASGVAAAAAAATGDQQLAVTAGEEVDRSKDPAAHGLDSTFVWDPASQWFWSAENQLFYAPEHARYCTPDGVWTNEHGEFENTEEDDAPAAAEAVDE